MGGMTTKSTHRVLGPHARPLVPSLVNLFARSLHSIACSALLVSLARSFARTFARTQAHGTGIHFMPLTRRFHTVLTQCVRYIRLAFKYEIALHLGTFWHQRDNRKRFGKRLRRELLFFFSRARESEKEARDFDNLLTG